MSGDHGPEEGEPVDPVEVAAGMSVDELVDQLGGAGFGAGDVDRAADVYAAMQREDAATFLGLAGAMVPAGMKRVVADEIARGHVDVVVTTGANMVHDLVEALGGAHYHGSPHLDDVELHDEGIDRVYDVYLETAMFEELESHIQGVLDGLGEVATIQEVTAALGASVDEGWLSAAAEHDVPVYCPAIQDSVIGLQLWLHTQTEDFVLDALGDMDGLIDVCFDANRSGALLVGGGVPKNYVLQTMLVSPATFDFAVQLTTDTPEAGGSSGATLDEARSWGKVGAEGDAVTVHGDATVTLPLVIAAALERLDGA